MAATIVLEVRPQRAFSGEARVEYRRQPLRSEFAERRAGSGGGAGRSADREVDAGFAYDALGRTTQVPGSYAGGTALGTPSSPITYFENDMVASVYQEGGVTRSYTLDPARRVRQRTASDATTQTYHYSDDSDSPSWTRDKPTGANPPYARNIEGVDDNLVALVVSGTTTLQLTDLHGDVIATATTSTSATGPSSTFETDEFGVTRAGSPFNRYSWLGGKQRRTELASGAIAMGVLSRPGFHGDRVSWFF